MEDESVNQEEMAEGSMLGEGFDNTSLRFNEELSSQNVLGKSSNMLLPGQAKDGSKQGAKAKIDKGHTFVNNPSIESISGLGSSKSSSTSSLEESNLDSTPLAAMNKMSMPKSGGKQTMVIEPAKQKSGFPDYLDGLELSDK